jgi:hypothetical protein
MLDCVDQPVVPTADQPAFLTAVGKRLKPMQALWPPTPKEFERA